MARVPRERERTATPEELQEDRRRHLAAKAATSPISGPAPHGNLAHGLQLFADWKDCPACKRRLLLLTGGELCGSCVGFIPPRKAPSIHTRVAIHLHALFGTVNDNDTVTA